MYVIFNNMHLKTKVCRILRHTSEQSLSFFSSASASAVGAVVRDVVTAVAIERRVMQCDEMRHLLLPPSASLVCAPVLIELRGCGVFSNPYFRYSVLYATRVAESISCVAEEGAAILECIVEFDLRAIQP
eukprot:IDg22373t1